MIRRGPAPVEAVLLSRKGLALDRVNRIRLYLKLVLFVVGILGAVRLLAPASAVVQTTRGLLGARLEGLKGPVSNSSWQNSALNLEFKNT